MTDPTLLMVARQDLPEHTPEAEPVLVERTGSEVVLTLDDGERLIFDRDELTAALAA